MKFRTSKWADVAWGEYETDKQTRLRTSMPKSCLCDYSDAIMLVEGIITITGAGADVVARKADARTKQIIYSKIVRHSLIA